ncbi:homeobox protein Hox-A3-like [Melospiza melodia melodia]|uniref:homeobox protein Hox-A3-like n=1 Tax=Melospiza melodia melodia TaxID=1914991 RepID=UPI002FD5FAA6
MLKSSSQTGGSGLEPRISRNCQPEPRGRQPQPSPPSPPPPPPPPELPARLARRGGTRSQNSKAQKLPWMDRGPGSLDRSHLPSSSCPVSPAAASIIPLHGCQRKGGTNYPINQLLPGQGQSH